MANEVEIIVTGTNKSRGPLSEPEEDLDKLKRKAKEAQTTVKGLGDEFAKASEHGSDFEKALGRDVTYLDFIKARMVSTRAEVKNLGDEFNRTGSSDVFEKLTKSQSLLAELESVRKRLKGTISDGISDGAKDGGPRFEKLVIGAATGAAESVAGLFGKSLSSMPPEAQAALGASIVAVVAAAAPFIGAAMGGALLGGIATIGIGAGIASQIKDPDVLNATEDLKRKMSIDFRDAGSAFKQPILDSEREISDAFSHFAPELKKEFDSLAPSLRSLTAGLLGFAREAWPGVRNGLEAGQVVIERLAQDLPQLGHYIGEFFNEIKSDGPAGAAALHDLLNIIELLLLGMGEGINLLSKIYQGFKVMTDLNWGNFTGLVEDIVGVGSKADDTASNMRNLAVGVDLAGGAAMDASAQYQALITKLNTASTTSDSVAGAMSDRLFGSLIGIDQATLHVQESFTSLTQTLQNNKNALDIHTQAGQQDREAILAAVQANIQMYDSQISVGMSATDAAAAYDANTQALERQLRQAGLTQAQIDGLIGKYASVPDKVNTDIAINGLTNAIEDLDTLLRQINGLHDKDITIAEHVYTYQDPSQTFHSYRATGGIVGAAGGGPRGGLVEVGEMGRELVRLPYGSQVYSHGDSERMMADAGGSSAGGGTLVVEWAGDTNSAFATALAELNRKGVLNFKWKGGI